MTDDILLVALGEPGVGKHALLKLIKILLTEKGFEVSIPNPYHSRGENWNITIHNFRSSFRSNGSETE